MTLYDGIIQSIVTGAGLFWKAFWALALGYAVSAAIQVFVSKDKAAQYLGSGSPRQLGLAALLGFASSSCSFAALSATRSLFTKGASLVSSLAFMFASTNLAIEVAILSYIFLGWQYALALFMGAPILIVVTAIFVKLTKPNKLTRTALKHAKSVESSHQHGQRKLKGSLIERLKRKESWLIVGTAYVAEWKMVYKELIAGFLVAGFVATLVPGSFFQSLFPIGGNSYLQLIEQSLLAPVAALITVIGSMGNGPLAALLANNGVMFGAIMTFLYSDFIVPPALKINARYYGWKFSLYLGSVFVLSAVVAGITIHLLFQVLGILPEVAKSIEELSRFKIDYTFFLNLFSLIIALFLFYLKKQNKAHV